VVAGVLASSALRLPEDYGLSPIGHIPTGYLKYFYYSIYIYKIRFK
jgi:hypothetical protein